MAEEAKEEVYPMAVPDSVKEFSEDGKNSTKIYCMRCPSLVLSPKAAKYKRKEMFLPHIKKKSEDQKPEDGETLTDFWVVGDMYDFDNVGFSHIVGNIRYLTCADCEIGPIGFHDLEVKGEYLIAVDRVKHG